jgi:amylosucrase
VHNVYAMRPEVRAEFACLRAQVGADAPFLTRLERFFTELRDPLVALYGSHPGFGAQFEALVAAMTRAAAERDPDLRRLDHEREITPDWLLHEQTVATSTASPARCAACASACRTCASWASATCT